jgi:hypothetical protein
MSLLLVPLILGGVFALLFAMAWLEPDRPADRRATPRRRTGSL